MRAVCSAAEAEEGLRDIWKSSNTCRMLGSRKEEKEGGTDGRGRGRRFKDASDIEEGCSR